MNIGKTSLAIANKIKSIATSGKQYITNMINKHPADFCHFAEQADKGEALKHLYSMLIKLTPEDVGIIEKANNKDATKYCYDLVCKSMKIPEEIAPEFIIEKADKEVPRLSGQYNFMTNELKYFSESSTNTKLGKWWTFGLLRHEMEHFRQNIDMLRNKDTSKKLFSYYKELFEKADCPKEDIAEYFKALKDFQKMILKHYPTIKTGSKEYKHADKLLQNHINYTLGTQGAADRLHYFIQPMEFEACRTQGFNWINYCVQKHNII